MPFDKEDPRYNAADTGETTFADFDAGGPTGLTGGQLLIRKGFEDGINLARMMAPSVEDVLKANQEGLADYTTKFAEAGVTNVKLATLLSTDDLKGMLPDAPLSDILQLRHTFARVASGERLDTGSSATAATKTGKAAVQKSVDPKTFPVLFKLMVKYVIEDEDHNREGNVLLIGTVILQAPKWPTKDGEMRFRINDEAVKPEQMQLRRTIQVDGLGERRTYQVAIPLNKDVIFGLTPFEVSQAAFLFEIESEEVDYYEDSEKRTTIVRPNILINRVDERELVVVRRGEELDKSDTYAFASLAPKLSMKYDKRKKYCPKFDMTLYIEKPVVSSFDPNTLMPIVLVAVLGTINVILADDAGPALDNSIAIALTAVFVLPALATGEVVKGQSGWWMTGPIYSLFVGIILASLCNIDGDLGAVDAADLAGANASLTTALRPQEIVNWTGVGFMWFSPVILLLYIVKHWLFVRHIKRNEMVEYIFPEGTTTSKQCMATPGDTVKRLIGVKDNSFNQWEYGVYAEQECENGVPPQAKNMMSVNDVWNETPKGYIPGNDEAVDNAASPMWRRDPEKEREVTLVCGPTHV